MPSATTVVSSGENDVHLRQTRWFGHDAAKGTPKAEVSMLRGQRLRQRRLSSRDILAQHMTLSNHFKSILPAIAIEWLMTDSWKRDQITSAVQMMDTCNTRDDSEEQEHSLHNQQVRLPQASRLVRSPKRRLPSSPKSIVSCTPVRTVMTSQTSTSR